MKRSLAVFGTPMLAFAMACSEQSSGPRDLEPEPLNSVVCAVNPDWDALKAEADSIMTPGSANAQSTRAQLDSLMRICASPNQAAAARKKAIEIAEFTVERYESGALRPAVPSGWTAEQKTLSFINHVLEAAIVGFAYSQLNNSWIVNPGDTTTTFVTDDGAASITVGGSDVDSTTLITAEELPPSPGYLQTDLDQYARYYRFSRTSLGGDTLFNNPVTISICVLTPRSLPDSIFNRLRIGAQHADGFEVTPPATPPVTLDCAAAAARLRAKGGAWASIIGDDGSGLEARGGVGGAADNFSEFGVVDPEITARGGVGGAADNFRPGPVRPRVAGLTMGTCSTVEAAKGSQVPAECRPSVNFATAVGQTPLDGIPVTFTVLSGEGQVAVENTDGTCGPFATSVVALTGAGTGAARVCWTLGAVGENKVGAKAANGGDAQDGTWFAYAAGQAGTGDANGIVFTATGLKLDGQASATGGTFSYNGQPFPGSGSCTPSSLVPVLSYSPGGAGQPVNAGDYSVTVSCGGAGTDYNTTTASASITITKAVSLTTVSCPATAPYTGAPVTPCTALASGAGGMVASVPVLYSGNTAVGLATALALYPGGPNHLASAGSGTFNVTPATPLLTLSCEDATYTGSPITTCTAAVTPADLTASLGPISYLDNINAGTATATVALTGDQNYSDVAANASFTISQATSTTTVTCQNVTYNGALQTPCTARAVGAGGLNVPVTVSYVRNLHGGNALGTATYAGDVNHLSSSGAASFFIAPLNAMATASSATIEFGASAAKLPCAVSGVLPGDVDWVTCYGAATYNKAGTFVVAPVVVPTSSYFVTKVNGTLTVLPYTKSCVDEEVFASLPAPGTGLPKGTPIPIWCTLANSQGVPVANARGDVEIRRAGASPGPQDDPLTYPVVASATNAFTVLQPSLQYEYMIDRTPAAFVTGQYYYVIVRWNDGTSTTGWFYLP